MLLTNSATLLVGPSGSGKTSLIGTYAEYVYEKTGKITRYYAADPGGYGDKVQALIGMGIIQVWRIRTRDPDGSDGLPLETIERATQGYWPKVVDPKTGDVERRVELIAPRDEFYEMLCKNGHLAKRAQTKAKLQGEATCETCKVKVTTENCLGINLNSAPNKGFENVGAYAFDGLTSFSNWCMQDMGARMSRNELGGEKAAINAIKSGLMTMGGTNRAGVGFVQGRAEGWIQNAIALKDLAAPPLFTALELMTSDDNNVPIYGPKIVGVAKTPDVPSWVGNCLGTCIVETDKGREWRLYLEQYTTKGDSTPHLCKNRAAPGSMPQYLADAPGEEAFVNFNLGNFFNLLEAALVKEETRYGAKFTKVPGMPSGKLEVPKMVDVSSGVNPLQSASKAPGIPAVQTNSIPMAGIPMAGGGTKK